jgi:hypothetical protein
MWRRFAAIAERLLLVSPKMRTASGNSCPRISSARAITFPDRLGSRRANGFQKVVRLANAKIVKKYLVKLVVVILPGMDQNVVCMAIEPVDNAGQPNDFRPRTDDRHHLKHRAHP